MLTILILSALFNSIFLLSFENVSGIGSKECILAFVNFFERCMEYHPIFAPISNITSLFFTSLLIHIGQN